MRARFAATMTAVLALACAPADPPAYEGPLGPSPRPTAAPAPCAPGRVILRGEAQNARDLGGIPVGEGEMLACDRLFRGGQPAYLSPRGCEELADRGITTIVDLRTPSEVRSTPDTECGPAIVPAPLPVPYQLSADDYIAALDARASMRAVFARIAEPAPLYFHCVYGRDRTGVVAAVLLRALGVSRDEIMLDYQRTQDAGLFTRPESLEAVLDELDARGGVAAYLGTLGVTTATITALRARLVIAAE